MPHIWRQYWQRASHAAAIKLSTQYWQILAKNIKVYLIILVQYNAAHDSCYGPHIN
jgi:hypothetical protein